MAKLEPFDKYHLYLNSVQSPEADVDFFTTTYKEIRKKPARILREDFCGTFGIATEWVKLNPKNIAMGVDLDPEPIEYGMKTHFASLNPKDQKRLQIHLGNVLNVKLPKSDIIVAVNFSYYLFKTRLLLKTYFKRCLANLKDDGVLMVDCFGGPMCMEPNEEEKVLDNFSYFWDEDKYDPITHEAQFYIHFKRKGEKKREKVFSYDWRMWTIPEIREAMLEAGFSKTYVYWEGTDKKGEGNGVFTRVEGTSEDCGAWVAYIIAVP